MLMRGSAEAEAAVNPVCLQKLGRHTFKRGLLTQNHLLCFVLPWHYRKLLFNWDAGCRVHHKLSSHIPAVVSLSWSLRFCQPCRLFFQVIKVDFRLVLFSFCCFVHLLVGFFCLCCFVWVFLVFTCHFSLELQNQGEDGFMCTK